jgi:hypothetical protein
MKNAVFRTVALCGCYKNRRFGWMFRLRHQFGKNQLARNNVSSIYQLKHTPIYSQRISANVIPSFVCFHPDHDGEAFFRNADSWKSHMELHFRRQHSSTYIIIENGCFLKYDSVHSYIYWRFVGISCLIMNVYPLSPLLGIYIRAVAAFTVQSLTVKWVDIPLHYHILVTRCLRPACPYVTLFPNSHVEEGLYWAGPRSASQHQLHRGSWPRKKADAISSSRAANGGPFPRGWRRTVSVQPLGSPRADQNSQEEAYWCVPPAYQTSRVDKRPQ